MRILITHPSKTSRGGIFNATLLHAIGLKAIGHEVVIATGSEALVPFAQKYGVPVIFDVKFDQPLGPVYSFGAGAKLRKLGRLDAVIHQGGKSWIWGRMFFPGAQHSVIFHNSRISLRKYFKNWMVLSSAQLEILKDYKSPFLNRNIERIKNGFFPPAPVSGVRDDHDVIRIGSVAEMRKVKGFDVLLEAFHELIIRGHKVELVLGGDGGELPGLKKRVAELGLEDYVKFPGWFEDVSKFYEMIDIFCLPSLDEPFGLVVLEAMSAGLPVVATKTYGPVDIVDNGKNGILVNINDKHDLVLGLQKLLEMDEGQRNQLASAGQEHAERNYGFEAVGRSLEEAIYNFASQKSLLPFGRSIKKPG